MELELGRTAGPWCRGEFIYSKYRPHGDGLALREAALRKTSGEPAGWPKPEPVCFSS